MTETIETRNNNKKPRSTTIAIIAGIVILLVAVCIAGYLIFGYNGAGANKGATVSTDYNTMQKQYTDPTLKTSDTSAGIAAKVGDTEIGEAAITASIEKMRESSDLTSTEAWKAYLEEQGETTKDLRKNTIDTYVTNELTRQAAEQEGVQVYESDVNDKIAQAKEAADGDDAWQQQLKDSGDTQETYRASIVQNLLYQALMDKTVGKVSASDDDVLNYITTYTVDYKKAKSLSEIPADTVSKYRETCDYMAQSKKFSTWFNNFKNGVSVTIYDMPSGLSYDIA